MGKLLDAIGKGLRANCHSLSALMTNTEEAAQLSEKPDTMGFRRDRKCAPSLSMRRRKAQRMTLGSEGLTRKGGALQSLPGSGPGD